MTDWPEILAAVVVEPGDQLVVLLPAGVGDEEARQFRERLVEWFGDRAAVIVGAEQLAVIKPEVPS